VVKWTSCPFARGKITAQYDIREKQLIKMFGLFKDRSEHPREGVDAFFALDESVFPFELKSTTKKNKSVSTARDLGMRHIHKFRQRHWLFAIMESRSIAEVRYGSPSMMEPWISKIEAKILKGENLKRNCMGILFDNFDVMGLNDALQIEKYINRGITLNDPCIPWSLIRTLPVVENRADLAAIMRGENSAP
jgi:hypothetical protein